MYEVLSQLDNTGNNIGATRLNYGHHVQIQDFIECFFFLLNCCTCLDVLTVAAAGGFYYYL